ncbi:MAG: ERCC4 domain-containing protein [Spirochaetota bacterium]
MSIKVDYRENKSGIIELLKKEDIDFTICKLKYGDFLINNSVFIERKTSIDFILFNIRWKTFFSDCKHENNQNAHLLIIEGDLYNTNIDIHLNAIKGALISITAIWNIPIIFSESIEDTKNILILIQTQYKKKELIPLRKGRKYRKMKSKQLYLLQGLPDIGPVKAKKLLDHFGSVLNVFNAREIDLLKVNGIGKKLVSKIKEVLTYKI